MSSRLLPRRPHLGRHRRAPVHRVARVQVRVEPSGQVEAPEGDVRPPRHLSGLRRLAHQRHAHPQHEAGRDEGMEHGAVAQGRPHEHAGLRVDGAGGCGAGDAHGHVLEVHAVNGAHWWRKLGDELRILMGKSLFIQVLY